MSAADPAGSPSAPLGLKHAHMEWHGRVVMGHMMLNVTAPSDHGAPDASEYSGCTVEKIAEAEPSSMPRARHSSTKRSRAGSDGVSGW